jgi:hypothetical protein
MKWNILSKDKRAEIQGMPLVIIIMVIVAVVVLGIIIGWFVFIDDDDMAKQLKIDKSGLPTVTEGDTSFTVTVLDAEKNPVEDATVYASGCGVDKFGTHKGNGEYEIDCTAADLHGDATGTINVEVTKSGYTSDSCQVVIKKAT